MRRAYALIVVLLLVLTSSVLTATMLDRLGAQSLAYGRTVDQYQHHHGKASLEEVVGAWLRSLGNLNIADMLVDDGHVFSLTLADRSTARVYLADGQGSVLSRFVGLSAENRRDAPQIYRALENLVGPENAPRFSREIGPMAVGVRGATREAIAAALSGVIPAPSFDPLAVADAILAEAADGSISSGDITRVARDRGVPQEQLALVNRVLSANTTVWRLRVELYSPSTPVSAPRLTNAYEGYAMSGRVAGTGTTRYQIVQFRAVEDAPGR